MKLEVSERDKRLLRLVLCFGIAALCLRFLLVPAIERHGELSDRLDSVQTQQEEWQAAIDSLSHLDQDIADRTATRSQASAPYYEGKLETRQMDDLITELELAQGLFPQSLTLTEAAPGSVAAYVSAVDAEAAPEEETGTRSSDIESAAANAEQSGEDNADTSDSTDAADSGEATPSYVYVGTATLQAQGSLTSWVNFLDAVETKYDGLRVTSFQVSDKTYLTDGTETANTELITCTLDIYMCVPGEEAVAP